MDEFVCGKVLVVKDHAGNRLPDLVCALPFGHDGHHRTLGGAMWMNTRDALEALRTPADAH